MRYIYGDVLFVLNGIFDFALLWFIRRYAGLRGPAWRLWLAAGAGAGYALLTVFPGWWDSAVVRLLVPLPLLLIAFAPLSPAQAVRGLAFWYVGALLFGGAAFAIAYARQVLANGLGLTVPVPWWVPVAGILAGACLFRCFWQRRQSVAVGPLCEVEIYLYGAAVSLVGLVDTGNQLRDPLGDLPVVVVECDALARLLPAQLFAIYRDGQDEDLGRIGECLSGSALAPRLRVIPFTSVGRQSGLLLGFRPDLIRVRASGTTSAHTDAVVCLYRGTLAHDGTYQALLHPDLALPATDSARPVPRRG